MHRRKGERCTNGQRQESSNDEVLGIINIPSTFQTCTDKPVPERPYYKKRVVISFGEPWNHRLPGMDTIQEIQQPMSLGEVQGARGAEKE